jgi:hypothetical protein
MLAVNSKIHSKMYVIENKIVISLLAPDREKTRGGKI